MSTFATRICVVFVIVATLCVVTVLAEQPSREDLARRILMTRHHWFYEYPGISDQYSGLWDFDPDSGDLRQLRPLSLTLGTDDTMLSGPSADNHMLAVIGNRLVVQMWPHLLDIEVPSWRLLRRYPPAAGLEPVGWAVLGPMLPETDAAAVGLEPGLYGFAQCVLVSLTQGYESPARNCQPHAFPGWNEERVSGDGTVLLRRGLEPLADEVTFVGETTPSDPAVTYLTRSLSFDAGRGGFWRAGLRTIEFFPVSDETVGPATIVEEPSFPPFDREEAKLSGLYYHPVRSRLFGTAPAVGGGNPVFSFFQLDEQLSLSRDYHDVGDPESLLIGTPISMTSLRSAPETYEQTIPVVSHTRGRYATVWSTDLWLYNPSDEPMAVHIRRVIKPDVERTVEIPPHGSLEVIDALTWIGGGPQGDGVKNDALVLTSPSRWGEELVAVSRTYNTDEEGGSYGQAVPAVPGTVGYSNHLPYDPHDPYSPEDEQKLWRVRLPGLRASHVVLDRRTPDRYRHNLGVVNDADQPVTLTLVWGWMEEDDSLLQQWRPPQAVRTVEFEPHSVTIVNLESRFADTVKDHWPPRVAVFGDRPVLLWLSMVDNLTGDATFVPYTNFHYMTDSHDDRSVLPVVAHNPGKQDTVWTTDLYGVQGNIDEDRPFTVFHPQSPLTQCGGAAVPSEISTYLDGDIGMPIEGWLEVVSQLWEPPLYPRTTEEAAKTGWRMVFPDAVHLFDECEGEEDIKGGLEISTASWTSGYSRTYTTRPDGGTYGGMLPLYPPNGWPVQHFAGIEVGGEFRINLGFFNGDHEHTITHRVTLYRADGTEVASTEFDLAPLRLKQQSLERVLGLAKGALEPGTYGLTVLPLDDEEAGVQGRSWAFVSLVENTTGDPTNWW